MISVSSGDHRVVERAGDLAEVVHQRGQHEQVGPGGVAQRGLDADHGLHLVPVHRVAVHGVALRPVPHPGPLRDPAGDQAGPVQRLPDGGQCGAACQHGHELVAGGGRPGVGQRRAVVGEVLDRDRGQRQTGPDGGGGGPHREHRILGGRDAGAEHDLAVVLDQAVAERAQPGAAGAGAQPAGGQRLAGPPDGDVDGVGDGAGGVADLGEQLVGVGQPAGHGDGVLLGQQQPVGALAGDRLEGVADVEQPGVRLVDGAVRPVGHPAGRQRAQHGDVTQAAAGLLEVGFQ
jgi:hypothetical protein